MTLDNNLYHHFVDEEWLRKIFEKQYSTYFQKMMSEKNVWHQLPVGAKREIQNLSKKEEDEVISIYLPDEFKCAFANLANALYAIHDYDNVEFFEKHMESDYDVLTDTLLLHDDGTKAAKNQIVLALRLLQFNFGYQVIKLKKYDTLLDPPLPGTI